MENKIMKRNMKQVYLVKDKNGENVLWSDNLNKAYEKAFDIDGRLFILLEDFTKNKNE